MKQLVRIALLGMTAGALVSAQDAVKALPGSYVLQFENAWVRIVRVHYEPFAKLPAHTHTSLASAYVYLNDGGPVVFKHVGKEYGAATRPKTTAGSFRLYRGLEEIHEVENTSALPSDFLRVEFKTDPKDARTLRGKFFREETIAGENLERRQFENEQIRVTRLVCASGRELEIATLEGEPSLLLGVSAARLSAEGAGSALELKAGQERWIAPNHRERLRNVGSAPAELLRFDFKTPPAQ